MKPKAKTIAVRPISALKSRVVDLLLLVKFKLTLTVVFSAFMAFLIAAGPEVDWTSALLLLGGGFLVTGSANALNQVLEKDYDRLMTRTADRPLAAGRMSVSEGVLIGGVLGLTGITLLAAINPWASFLGTLALLSYAFLYTPLKRSTPLAITVGAFPGALPVLIGCVAAEGELTLLGFALFAIQFLWQFPHFGAIGWLGYEDYRKAGFQFVQGRDPQVGLSALVYAALLLPIGLLPFWLGVTGWLSALMAVLAAGGYAWMAFRLFRENSRRAALGLMFWSFAYLPVVLTAFWLDKI